MITDKYLKYINSAKTSYSRVNHELRNFITYHSAGFDVFFKNFVFYFIILITIFHVYYFYVYVIGNNSSYEHLHYLHIFHIFIQLLLCLYLIFRFHPFRHHDLHSSDTTLIFYCSAFLLWTIIVDGFFTQIQSVIPVIDDGSHKKLPEEKSAEHI